MTNILEEMEDQPPERLVKWVLITQCLKLLTHPCELACATDMQNVAQNFRDDEQIPSVLDDRYDHWTTIPH